MTRSHTQPGGRVRVGVAAAIVGTFVVLSLMAGCNIIIWGQNVVQADWRRRYICEATLSHIHQAIGEYVATYGRPPARLEALADAGLCHPESLICGSPLRPYRYAPDAWGRGDRIMVSDDTDYHNPLKGACWLARSLSPRVRPAQYAVFGDGKVRDIWKD